MDKEVALSEIGGFLGLSVTASNRSEIFAIISDHVTDLINNDFPKLVQLLYRLDVSEKLLLQELKNHPDQNAGDLITNLMIERQLKKIETRQQFRKENESESEEERW